MACGDLARASLLKFYGDPIVTQHRDHALIAEELFLFRANQAGYGHDPARGQLITDREKDCDANPPGSE